MNIKRFVRWIKRFLAQQVSFSSSAPCLLLGNERLNNWSPNLFSLCFLCFHRAMIWVVLLFKWNRKPVNFLSPLFGVKETPTHVTRYSDTVKSIKQITSLSRVASTTVDGDRSSSSKSRVRGTMKLLKEIVVGLVFDEYAVGTDNYAV